MNNGAPGQAWEEGIRQTALKLFDRTLWVSNPIRPRFATSRNRVLRESPGDRGREAYTGSKQAA